MHKPNCQKDDHELAPILKELKKRHLRITEPRKAILKMLVDHHGPFSAEELHKRIKKGLCDLATIYRCLTTLEEVRIVKRCEFGDGTARYELANKDDHHHHVICISCKKVEVLADCKLDEIDRFALKRGYSNVSHSLEFFGTCSDCH